jgi:hypothetical protein
MKACALCKREALLVALHGDRGGPDVCLDCSGKLWAESRATQRQAERRQERATDRHDGTYAREDELDTELRRDVLALIHPDRHVPELKAKATAVTARFGALYVLPPRPPERDGSAEGARADRVENVSDLDWTEKTKPDGTPLIPSGCDGHCEHLLPGFRCDVCRAEDERTAEWARRADRLARTAVECWGCGKSLTDGVWRWTTEVDAYHLLYGRSVSERTMTLPHCETCWQGEFMGNGYVQTKPCESCGRPVTNAGRSASRRVWACSENCAARVLRAQRRERKPKPCEHCGEDFTPGRKDTRYCSQACKQKAHRKRKAGQR